MLCETWTNEFSDIDVQGYVRISKTRKLKKKAKRSSGGLEIYIKENLIKGVSVLNWDFEDGLNLKFDSATLPGFDHCRSQNCWLRPLTKA